MKNIWKRNWKQFPNLFQSVIVEKNSNDGYFVIPKILENLSNEFAWA